MKSVIIIAITVVCSAAIFSILPDADAKTWKVYVSEMPKHWESQFGNIYYEGTAYWKKQVPGTYFTEITQREKADFVVQWSSQFQGNKLGYYTSSTNNDFGKPFIAITLGYMDDESVKWQDRKFNLVDEEYAKLITIHELGHAIGFGHSDDPGNIMYEKIYNYNNWLSAKQLGDLETNLKSSGNVISQYTSKSIAMQEEANFKVEKAKEHIYSKQDLLYSKHYENPNAQEELNKAWTYLDEAKNYLGQAEWTQKEGEDYIKSFEPKNAYYKYVYSFGMVNKVWDPINAIDSIVESAEKLESEYQENKESEPIPEQKEEKKQTCFLFWCW